MRIALVYPDQPKWPKFKWVAKALRELQHDVTIVRTLDGLVAADAANDLVVFSQKDAGLDPGSIVEAAENRKSTWVQWWFDLVATDADKSLAEQPLLRTMTYAGREWEDTSHLKVMRCMDAVFVKERGLLDDYRALGVPAEYLDQGCPSWMAACEHREIPEWDVLVFGTMVASWRQRRHDVMSLLTEGVTVAWAGHPGGSTPSGCLPLPFCPAADLPALASRAAVVLCVDFRQDLDGYCSDRLWLALGIGACVVRRQSAGVPQHESYFRYDDDRELIATVARLHGSVLTRQAHGKAARRWVMANHTVQMRCERLIELCRDLPKKRSAGPARAPAK